MARRRNFEEETLFLWSMGAALVGTIVGYGVCRFQCDRSFRTWKYWVSVTEDGFVPWIEDPCGHQQSFEAQPSNELAEMSALQMMPPKARPKKSKAVLG